MSDSHDIPAERRYVPGWGWAKLGLAAFGILLVIASLDKFAPFSRAMAGGERVYGEAVRVRLIDAAGHERILATQSEVQAASKAAVDSRDRSTVFWLEYRFSLADGRTVEARSPIGQLLKPMHDLRDADGLPARIRLWVDPIDPQRVVIPFQFLPGTWLPFGFGTFFLPGMFLLFGCLGTFMGLLLWWHSRKPIELPDLSRAHGEAQTRKLPAGGGH